MFIVTPWSHQVKMSASLKEIYISGGDDAFNGIIFDDSALGSDTMGSDTMGSPPAPRATPIDLSPQPSNNNNSLPKSNGAAVEAATLSPDVVCDCIVNMQ